MPSGVKDIQILELKDTISQLNKTISTQNELISSLQKMLEERNAKDSEKDLLIANLQSQLAYLKNKVFALEVCKKIILKDCLPLLCVDSSLD